LHGFKKHLSFHSSEVYLHITITLRFYFGLSLKLPHDQYGQEGCHGIATVICGTLFVLVIWPERLNRLVVCF